MSRHKSQSNFDFKFMSFFFKIRDKFHPPIEKVKKAEIKSGDIVLDYGCGPGSYTIAAAEAVGASGKVYAADLHRLAIKKVRNKVLKKGIKNIEIIQTECDTRLKANSVDVVICFDVLHVIDDQVSILKELHRVLKPNGQFSFDDHHMKENEVNSLILSPGLFSLKEKKGKQYNFVKV